MLAGDLLKWHWPLLSVAGGRVLSVTANFLERETVRLLRLS